MSIQLSIVQFTDEYSRFMAPYSRSETIPTNLFGVVLAHHFQGGTILHTYKDNHFIMKVPLKELLNAPMNNWEHNRPPDNVRCQDIARAIYTSKHPIESMFYLSYNNLHKTFDILDGIHRYTSLKIIQRENAKPANLQDPEDFGGDNDAAVWLFQSSVILNIRFNTNIGDLIKTFQTLNKSHPVSELYIRDVTRERRTIIEAICDKYQKKYPTHFSANISPQVPNVNRGKFVDLLDKLYDKHRINEINKNKLEEVLEEMSANTEQFPPKKVTKKAMDKCRETGGWLFLDKKNF